MKIHWLILGGALFGLCAVGHSLANDGKNHFDKELGKEVQLRLEQMRKEPWLGLRGKILESNPGEAEIIYVWAQGPAEVAGLEVGDMLLAIDGQRLDTKNWEKSVRDYRAMSLDLEIGSKAVLSIRRGDEEMELEIQVAACPWFAMDSCLGWHFRRLADPMPPWMLVPGETQTRLGSRDAAERSP